MDNPLEESRIIESYQDFKPVGMWGVLDVVTGESKVCGELMSRTVKIANQDGSIGLDFEWVTDEDARNENLETQ